MKTRTFIFGTVLGALIGQFSTASAAPAAIAAKDQPARTRIVMLSDGGTFGDHSFNQNCREGLEEFIYSGAPIYVQFFETVEDIPFEKHLAAFAERNYRIIIGIGYLMGPSIQKVAAKYPRTYFISVDGEMDSIPQNVQLMTYCVDQCAYLAGHLAAAWADLKDPENPAVGYVAGKNVSSVQPFLAGYRAGVENYNRLHQKNVQVSGHFVGSFDDPKRGHALAIRLLDKGADVIFGVAGQSGVGAIQAVKERGKWAIGVDTDQYYTLLDLQDVLLTSCLKRMDRTVHQAVGRALDNQFQGGIRYEGTLANHGVGLAPFHDYEDEIPAAISDELADIQRRLIAGTLTTGWDPSVPFKKE